MHASNKSTGSESAAYHVEALTAELREERQLLARQRKEREMLENNLSESKLMVASLTDELASAKHGAAIKEQELKALAHAKQELEQERESKLSMERRLSEVEAELKTALLDRASVRSQQRQASQELEQTDRERSTMALTMVSLNDDHGVLKNELAAALRDKNKAEAALRSSMEEVPVRKRACALDPRPDAPHQYGKVLDGKSTHATPGHCQGAAAKRHTSALI